MDWVVPADIVVFDAFILRIVGAVVVPEQDQKGKDLQIMACLDVVPEPVSILVSQVPLLLVVLRLACILLLAFLPLLLFVLNRLLNVFATL